MRYKVRLIIVLGIAFTCALLLGQGVALGAGATYGETMHIAPIIGALTDENVLDMKRRLGSGFHARVGFSASFFYMSDTKGKASNFAFDSTNLESVIALSKRTNTPVVIIFNGGPWGGTVVRDPEVNLISYLEQDPNNVQWKSDGSVPGDDEFLPGLGRLLTYNNLNVTVRSYKEKIFREAAAIVARFYFERPDLLIGVNTDVEVFMSPFYYSDYNPQTIQEFQNYMRAKFGSMANMNSKMGTSFAHWDAIDPPRPPAEPMSGTPFAEAWTDFRVTLVDGEVQRQADWLREAGLPPERIYSHQTVRADSPYWARYFLASPLETASISGGSIGVTALQDLCFDEEFFAKVASWSPNWGSFEYNASLPNHNPQSASYNWGDHYQRSMRALEIAYKYGARIVAPYFWNEEGNEPQYTIKGTAYETAIRDFVRKAGTERSRLWGNTSHATAISILRQGWSRANVVLLARSDYFSDALAGVPLAYAMKGDPANPASAPILLTNPNVLSQESLAEMKRVGTKVAILLGGPGAISDGVAHELRLNGIGVDRVWQNSSYGTAADIARRMRAYSDSWRTFPRPDTAVITTGDNFPDALAIASPAASKNMPILLSRNNELPLETRAVISDLGIKKAIIVGGGAAITDNVRRELVGLGVQVLARFGGNTQYDTAVAIADQGDSLFGFRSPGPFFVTRGDHFTDGLTGGVLAARMGPVPIVLVEPEAIPASTSSFIADKKTAISRFYVLGGVGAISDSVYGQLRDL